MAHRCISRSCAWHAHVLLQLCSAMLLIGLLACIHPCKGCTYSRLQPTKWALGAPNRVSMQRPQVFPPKWWITSSSRMMKWTASR